MAVHTYNAVGNAEVSTCVRGTWSCAAPALAYADTVSMPAGSTITCVTLNLYTWRAKSNNAYDVSLQNIWAINGLYWDDITEYPVSR